MYGSHSVSLVTFTFGNSNLWTTFWSRVSQKNFLLSKLAMANITVHSEKPTWNIKHQTLLWQQINVWVHVINLSQKFLLFFNLDVVFFCLRCPIYVTQPDYKYMNYKMNHLHLSWKMIVDFSFSTVIFAMANFDKRKFFFRHPVCKFGSRPQKWPKIAKKNGSLNSDLLNFLYKYAGWQKLCGGTGGPRRKVWTRTKILSPNKR